MGAFPYTVGGLEGGRITSPHCVHSNHCEGSLGEVFANPPPSNKYQRSGQQVQGALLYVPRALRRTSCLN